MKMFELSESKKELLKTVGNILVLGGPGSGKSTIALLKAKNVIDKKELKNKQKVLFLSFARATVANIEQKVIDFKSSKSLDHHLEINTYHGFAWNILKSLFQCVMVLPKCLNIWVTFMKNWDR